MVWNRIVGSVAAMGGPGDLSAKPVAVLPGTVVPPVSRSRKSRLSCFPKDS